ncbi:MAG TPA: Tim44-like domain-containing protein, partial [Polyangiaceae bacterium]
RVRKLDCPNCGAPLEGMRGTTCGYCRTEVGGGRLDWLVERIERLATETRPPGVTAEVPEAGNQLPTLIAPGCQERLGALARRDPAHDPAALRARIGLVFHELQIGWSQRDLARIRPFVTDNLFQYFGYWLDAYSAQRARNVTENARILNVELAEVTSDASYDAVTVRLFATGLDYTLADDGRLLRGSRTRERPYSEYWTLIRGSAARGRARTDLVCPCCGAPLKIAMAGNCEYCSARVVSGEFDWVLSRIEQDEAYGG